MNRIGDLFNKVCSVENLELADKKARKGKLNYKEVIKHDKNRYKNILELHNLLINKEYKTSKYSIFKIYDSKEREIYKLPYYPDRIMHHALMNILEPIFVSTFTSDTYSCIKGRGIHKAFYKVKESLKDKVNTKYCLKLDIKKFYPNIDHNILKYLLMRKIKDNDLLDLLFEIIDSANGVPIGNYLSQYFANFYLTYFDHWLKQVKKVKYYFRYCDDLVIFGDNKKDLHKLLGDIREYLYNNLKLQLKSNYQIFPIDSRGLDFLGYKFYRNYILIRKRIKQNFKQMIKYNYNNKSITSYYGWMIHCNTYNLFNKYIK